MNQKSSASAGGAIWLSYAVTLGVMLLASLIPTGRLWGLNWYGYFSWYGPLILVVLGIAVPMLLSRRKDCFPVDPGDEPAAKPFWPTAALLTILFTWAYVVFSARMHFLGDGYQLLASLQSGVNYKPWETGTFQIQKSVYALLGGQGEEAAERALQITSWASGLLFALVSAFVSTRLFSNHRRRLLYFLGATTGGYALLFFGYLESYPFFILAVGGLFQLGLLIAKGRLSRWLTLPLIALAAFLHIFTVALLPGAVYLLLRGTPIGARIAGMTGRTKIATATVIMVMCGAVFAHFYYHSYFFRFTITPPWADRFTVEGYTMFSGKHVLDYLNHFFQLLPGLAVILTALWFNRKRLLLKQPEMLFTLLTLLPSMALVFIFNPGLGFPRDWDLFGFVGVPLVCGVFFLLLDEERSLASGTLTAALAVVLGCLVLAPRVATQVLPEKAIAVFDDYSNLDIIRNESGRYILLNYLEKEGRLAEKADREKQNGRLLPHEAWDKEGQLLYRDGNISQAEARFRKAVEYAPSFAYSWANLGVCFTQREQWDSALVYFQIADALNPFNSDNCNSIGWVYLNQGVTDKAEEYCSRAVRLRPGNFKARANLAKLYREQGKREELIKLLSGVSEVPEVPAQTFFEYADQLIALGETETARRICRQAIEAGAERSMIEQFETDHPGFRIDSTTP
jgi:tetratricopeptide (TPR) repeat protein